MPVLILPSATQCVSHRDLTIHVRRVSGVTVIGVTVKVDGKLFKRFKFPGHSVRSDRDR